jgi:hypothetical protein
MSYYFTELKALHPRNLNEIFQERTHDPLLEVWEFVDEFKPIDLYCYFYAKYGPPNGIQNFLRKDDSDNLIHWEWALVNGDGLFVIQGHNFRTEAHTFRKFAIGLTRDDFVEQIKADFSKHGKEMKAIRLGLEKWTHFVNPYHRIASVMDRHLQVLADLDLNLERDRSPQPRSYLEMQALADSWKQTAEKYMQALGLAFGVRAMLPVLAESFVNFILFVLARPEIKNNKRLFSESLRRPIDARVQTLHLNCVGFNAPVDYENQSCKDFHTLMNERNDMLHGNIDVDRLSFEEIYFNGRVPIFTSYGSFWDKTIGLEARTVRFDQLEKDRSSIKAFEEYILGLLDSETRNSLERMLRAPQLGFDPKRNILGVLLPGHMVDGRMDLSERGQTPGQDSGTSA